MFLFSGWEGGEGVYQFLARDLIQMYTSVYRQIRHCVAVVCNVLRIQLAASTTDVALFFSFVLGARL